MKKYLAAATGALILAAASLSYAQPPPGTDKPKGETTTSKAAKGGMKGTTGKAAKKPKAAKRTKGGMSGGMKGKQDNWGDDWLRGWTFEKK